MMSVNRSNFASKLRVNPAVLQPPISVPPSSNSVSNASVQIPQIGVIGMNNVSRVADAVPPDADIIFVFKLTKKTNLIFDTQNDGAFL